MLADLRRRWISARKQVVLYNASKIFNPFFDLYTGGPNRPAFFDESSTYPALLAVQAAYPDIRAEMEGILADRAPIPRYHELDGDLIYVSGRFDRDKRWSVFMLYSYGARPAANRRRCPKTCAVLDRIPGLVQASFSILDGGKSIPAHEGPSRSYLRYHLALRVPKSNPPSIRIKDSWQVWEEGKTLFFDDSWDHEIVNRSEEPRVVLIVDVLRPLPLVPHLLNLALFRIGRLYGRRILKAIDAHARGAGPEAEPLHL